MITQLVGREISDEIREFVLQFYPASLERSVVTQKYFTGCLVLIWPWAVFYVTPTKPWLTYTSPEIWVRASLTVSPVGALGRVWWQGMLVARILENTLSLGTARSFSQMKYNSPEHSAKLQTSCGQEHFCTRHISKSSLKQPKLHFTACCRMGFSVGFADVQS